MTVTNRPYLILYGGRYRLLENWEKWKPVRHYPPLSGVELSPVMRQDTVRLSLMDPRCENRTWPVSSTR
jgi:hypothetical protein